MSVRIKGLIRALKRVRLTLQTGLSEEEVAPFQREVRQLIHQVEKICAQYGMTPEDLPTPSRNAYRFFCQIELDNLPLRPEESPQPQQPIRINKVVKTGNLLADWMWRRHEGLLESENMRQQFRSDIQRNLQQIERICKKNESTPFHLEKPSRQMYCWMRYLEEEQRLLEHLESLQRANKALQESDLLGNRSLQLHLVNMDSLWRMRQRDETVVFKCNQGFLHADQDVWQALLGNALAKRTPGRQKYIDEFAESESFSAVLFELSSYIKPPTSLTKGRHHDLKESFERINQSYFENRMERPRLRWNHVLTTRKFGHYQFSDDTVMLSISLDDERVPPYVFDFVMYHELLHKKHGLTNVNGRRVAHTPSFRVDEQKYERYQEAEDFLSHLSIQHR